MGAQGATGESGSSGAPGAPGSKVSSAAWDLSHSTRLCRYKASNFHSHKLPSTGCDWQSWQPRCGWQSWTFCKFKLKNIWQRQVWVLKMACPLTICRVLLDKMAAPDQLVLLVPEELLESWDSPDSRDLL